MLERMTAHDNSDFVLQAHGALKYFRSRQLRGTFNYPLFRMN